MSSPNKWIASSKNNHRYSQLARSECQSRLTAYKRDDRTSTYPSLAWPMSGYDRHCFARTFLAHVLRNPSAEDVPLGTPCRIRTYPRVSELPLVVARFHSPWTSKSRWSWRVLHCYCSPHLPACSLSLSAAAPRFPATTSEVNCMPAGQVRCTWTGAWKAIWQVMSGSEIHAGRMACGYVNLIVVARWRGKRAQNYFVNDQTS